MESRPVISLTEWQEVGPDQAPSLHRRTLDSATRKLAAALQDKLSIREGLEGLHISTTSWVGRVELGDLRIAVRPKLPELQLTPLLRYAYGLRDIKTFERATAPTQEHGLRDLLVAMLAAEVQELLERGLARSYIRLVESLGAPRGRILIDELATSEAIAQARLPCQHFQRQANWSLNRLIRAGLELAARTAADPSLRLRLHRLGARFEEIPPHASLTDRDIEHVTGKLTRLTAHYEPALTIIRLLYDMHGVTQEPGLREVKVSGYLFDMNMFFQRLLSRFLHEHLGDNQRIADEFPLRDVFAYSPASNPKGRRPPTPRPDFALFRGNLLKAFLDAKYRDLWNTSLPPDWLYQLAIYAQSSPSGISVMLYASMTDDARDQQIEVRSPLAWLDGPVKCSVILRAVSLPRLSNLLRPELPTSATLAARSHLASRLVRLGESVLATALA